MSEKVDSESAKKRAAVAGQWKTPPLPVFPTSNLESSAKVTKDLPKSPEDYARALEEAYRKGAQDAAQMAVQQSMSNAVSCPDFQVSAEVDVDMMLRQSEQETSAVPNPLLPGSMPPPPPVPMPDEVHSKSSIQPPQQRSISLPDMASYAAQQEEEKRQKRLARNRASARLRRLRKKNLVDAYEAEVGILEKTLAQLRKHEWGAQDNANALTEALSMDRGQQQLTLEQRKETTMSILKQQLEFVEMLEELMAEQYVLHNLKDSEEFNDLKEALQLTDEQYQQLEQAKSGWEEEWAALQTVKASLVALKENNWLWNENVTQIAEQFMSILHKNQISKFMLWTDHNSEAIDQLDIVHAAPTTADGPVFHFGAENHPESILDDDK